MYRYKVMQYKNGAIRPVFYTNDEAIARHLVDTREASISAYVIDAEGNVIYRNECASDDPLDMG